MYLNNLTPKFVVRGPKVHSGFLSDRERDTLVQRDGMLVARSAYFVARGYGGRLRSPSPPVGGTTGGIMDKFDRPKP